MQALDTQIASLRRGLSGRAVPEISTPNPLEEAPSVIGEFNYLLFDGVKPRVEIAADGLRHDYGMNFAPFLAKVGDGRHRPQEATLDREGFGTCGMYFESVYPVMDESAGADACVPGSTFRTKYYSATSAAGLGADFQAAAKAFSASGRRGAAVALVGFGFAGGVVAAVMTVTAARIQKWSRRASEEGGALLPQ